MAGTVKKLQFSEGTDVGAPTDLSLASSTSVIEAYANDGAFVTAEGAAASGSVYLNTTLNQFRYFTNSNWRNAVPESDSADPTKKFLVNLTGATTAKTATFTLPVTLDRVFTFPDATTTVVGTDVSQTLTLKTISAGVLSSCTMSGSLDVGAAGNFTIGASVGANNLTLGGATSTVVIAGDLTVQGTTTTLNTATLEVEDINITVNNGGNDASSEGAGLSVERVGTNGSLIYANAATSKFKVGALGSEVEIATISGAQVLTAKDIDGGTASNTSRLTIPKAATATLSGLTRKEGTIVYDTDLDKPYYDNGAALVAFGSGSGTGEINAILNPSAVDATTGWSDDANHSKTRLTSSTVLDPIVTTSFRFTKDNTNVSTETSTSGVYYPFTLPVGLESKKLKAEFYCVVPATGVWKVSLYDGTTRLALTTDSSGATILPAGFTGKFTTYFDTTANNSYTISFTETSGVAVNLDATNIIVGPGIQPQGAMVGEWLSYTPTFSAGFGTVSAVSFKYRQVGSSLEVQGNVTTGTVAGSAATMTLPTGLTVGNFRSGTYGLVGRAISNNTTASNYKDFSVITQDTQTAFRFGVVEYASSGAEAGLLAQNGNAIFATGMILSMSISVPISEWSGSGTVNLAQNDVEYAFNSGAWDADDDTSFAYGQGGQTITASTNLTTARTKKVRFQTPFQEGEVPVLQFKVNEIWMTAPNVYLRDTGYHIQGIHFGTAATAAEEIGAGIQTIASTSTDVYVRFGHYSSIYNNATKIGWATSIGSSVIKWRVVKSKAGQAVGFGLADTAGNSGLVNPYLVGSGVVYAGTYTPTSSGASNVAITTKVTSYIRVGNTVYVNGVCDADVVSASTSTEFFITLPIASNLTLATDLTGIAMHSQAGAAYAGGQIICDTSGDKAQIAWTSGADLASRGLYFSFSYIIK